MIAWLIGITLNPETACCFAQLLSAAESPGKPSAVQPDIPGLLLVNMTSPSLNGVSSVLLDRMHVGT